MSRYAKFTYFNNYIEDEALSSLDGTIEFLNSPSGKLTLCETLNLMMYNFRKTFFKTKMLENLTCKKIIEWHSEFFINSEKRFRKVNVRAGNHIFTCHENVLGYMKIFCYNFNRKLKILDKNSEKDIINFAVEAQFNFVNIHPFRDGNGRFGRLLMSLVLEKFGLDDINYDDRKEYFECFNTNRTNITKNLKELSFKKYSYER